MKSYFWCWIGWLNIIKASSKNKVNESTEKEVMKIKTEMKQRIEKSRSN